mgnify:CR=1 FL=1
MKRYRIQVRHKGIYVEGVVASENDKDALITFHKNYEAGLYQEQREDLCDPNKCHIAIEETERDVTKVNLGKTSVGIQVGQPSVIAG